FPDWARFDMRFATSEEHLELALEVLWERLEKIKTNLDENEVENAKMKLTKKMHIRLQTSEAWVNRHTDECLFNPESIHTPEDFKEEILSLTKEDLQKVAQKYFHKDQFLLAICGGDENFKNQIVEKYKTKAQH